MCYNFVKLASLLASDNFYINLFNRLKNFMTGSAISKENIAYNYIIKADVHELFW